MVSTRLRGSLLSVGACTALAACANAGGGAPDAQGSLEFMAEIDALPGLELDTGMRPEGSPAQVQLVVRSGGGFFATASGRQAGGELEPVAGSGLATLGAELLIDVSARVDTAGVTWEGPLESVTLVVPEVDAVFDPFLLGGKAATLSAAVPRQELLSAPLGSVPGGTIVLTADTGTIDATFRGACAAASGDVASYRGLVRWSGAVQLTAIIAIDQPTGKDLRFPITVTVDIPAFETAVDLGTRSMLDGSSMDAASPCDGGGKGDDVGEGSSGDVDDRKPEAEVVDILVEQVKFSSSYGGTPWDGAAGSAADPFVFVEVYGDAPLRGATTTAHDTASYSFEQVVLSDVPVAQLLEEGLGFGILDEDYGIDGQVRTNVRNPDYPDDDYVLSMGTLVFADQLDGSAQTYDLDHDGVSGSVVLRFVPVP